MASTFLCDIIKKKVYTTLYKGCTICCINGRKVLEMADKVISIKDYALEKGISYEAVRKQVDRYKEELQGHIITEGIRGRFLDQEAVEFLDNKRMNNPISIYNDNKHEEYEKAIEEGKRLREQLILEQSKVIKLQEQLLQIKASEEKIKLLTAANEEIQVKWEDEMKKVLNLGIQNDSILAQNNVLTEKLEAEHNKLSAVKEENEQLKNMTPRQFKKFKKQLKKMGSSS